MASNDGENGFVSFEVSATGGQGLSGVAMDGGLALSYYDAANGQVTIATRTGDGSVATVAAAEVPEGSAEGPGARTGIALGSDGSVGLTWWDADEGVRFATGDPGSLKAVETGTSTVDGTFPTITVNEDGSVTYLAWYATTEGDLLVGGYGDFQDVPFAEPSPTPTGPITAPPPPTTECTPLVNGTVKVVAQGIAFTEGDCIQATAGEPFSIEFDNRDEGTQHNIEIFSGEEPTGDTVFSGDLVTGPNQVIFDVPALDAGTHAFNCVVHPTMVGKVEVTEGGGGGGGGGGGQGGGRRSRWRREPDRDRDGLGDRVRHLHDRPAGEPAEHDPLRERGQRHPAQHRDLPERRRPREPPVPRRPADRPGRDRLRGGPAEGGDVLLPM